MSKAFWLGLIGGIFGILGGIFAVVVGNIGVAFGAEGAEDFYLLGGSAIIFSILGIVAGAVEGRKKLRGIGMIICGIAVLVSISLFGILTLVLFVIGGILILKSD